MNTQAEMQPAMMQQHQDPALDLECSIEDGELLWRTINVDEADVDLSDLTEQLWVLLQKEMDADN